jgi:hypothetical protein
MSVSPSDIHEDCDRLLQCLYVAAGISVNGMWHARIAGLVLHEIMSLNALEILIWIDLAALRCSMSQVAQRGFPMPSD